MVEHCLAKAKVEGSNPFFRFSKSRSVDYPLKQRLCTYYFAQPPVLPSPNARVTFGVTYVQSKAGHVQQ